MVAGILSTMVPLCDDISDFSCITSTFDKLYSAVSMFVNDNSMLKPIVFSICSIRWSGNAGVDDGKLRGGC